MFYRCNFCGWFLKVYAYLVFVNVWVLEENKRDFMVFVKVSVDVVVMKIFRMFLMEKKLCY